VQVFVSLVIDEGAHVCEDRRAVREPILCVKIHRREPLDFCHINPVVNHADSRRGNAVVFEHASDGVGSGNEQMHLPVFPSREGIPLQVKVHAP
jgi:hypothetical protein